MHRQSLTAFLSMTMLLAMISAPADEPGRTIRVTGEGRATAPADPATIESGLISEASTAAEPLDENNQA